MTLEFIPCCGPFFDTLHLITFCVDNYPHQCLSHATFIDYNSMLSRTTNWHFRPWVFIFNGSGGKVLKKENFAREPEILEPDSMLHFLLNFADRKVI